MTDQKKPAYGGQAVVEGVMFAGKHTYVTAIRRNDDSIDYYEVLKPYNPWMNKIKRFLSSAESQRFWKPAPTAPSI